MAVMISLWRSREALQDYQRSVDAPGGVVLFRSVGAEPTLTMFEVVEEVTATNTTA